MSSPLSKLPKRRMRTAAPRQGTRMRRRAEWQKMIFPAAQRLPAPLRGPAMAAMPVVPLMAIVLVAVACTAPDVPPTTVRVSRGSVSAVVSATGSLQAITEQNMGFAESGKLVDLRVTVGQRVEQGEILARLDGGSARIDLDKARARLSREQAILDKLREDNEVGATADDFEHAKRVLDATKDQADAVAAANSAAVDEAKRQYDSDRQAFEAAEAAQSQAYECAEQSGSGYGNGDLLDTRSWTPEAEGYQPGGYPSAGAESGTSPSSGAESGASPSSGYESGGYECAQAAAEDAMAARRQMEASEAEVAKARQKQRIDNAQQDVAVENARRAVATARNTAEGAEDQRPHEIDEQKAAVEEARAEVENAEKAVEDTVLRAPVGGKIAAVNGTVGEFLAAASGTTALAPGSRAPLPEVNTGTTSEGSAASQNTRPGGSAFMVLSDLNTFRVVAPFEEADAAPLEANQQVDVTFDAVPGLARKGTVVAVAPTGTDIQGVTNYYVTIVLNELDPRLKDGQTAEANVVTSRVDDVLVVPNAAIQQGGQNGVVEVLQPDGSSRQIQVQLGLVGDTTTQVISGLVEGQQVVVAEAD